MKNVKDLTKADVYDVAMDLIEENGSTTTLDVKKELRKNGFFAKQVEVSNYMNEISDEENWNFTFNGVHRTYKFDTDDTDDTNDNYSSQLKQISAQPLTSKPNTIQTNKSSDSYTKRNGTVIETIDEDDATVGDYVAWSVSHDEILYFSAGYSRDDMRLAYYQITGTPFCDTRVKKIR